MPTNYDLQKKEAPTIPTERTRPVPEIPQEQITKSIEEILFQRMSQSEVELMKAENAELKKILASFGQNYNKFENLTNSLIQQNREELLKLINELHNKQEQRLKEQEVKVNALKTSNDLLNASISAEMMTMRDNIESDITSLYEKIDKNATERLKKYNDSINTLEKQTKQFWRFDGIKATLFWCMCVGMTLFVGKATLDLFEITIPVTIWQIAYVLAFIPLLGYLTIFIIMLIVALFKK